MDDVSTKWLDGFIVNLGELEWENNWQKPQDLDNWHVNWDFLLHFLDSREQALLVIPVISEFEPQGGGTMIASEGIGIARHLYEHPVGVMPRDFDPLENGKRCTDFHEITGSPGDVVLMHPFMLHSASQRTSWST